MKIDAFDSLDAEIPWDVDVVAFASAFTDAFNTPLSAARIEVSIVKTVCGEVKHCVILRHNEDNVKQGKSNHCA